MSSKVVNKKKVLFDDNEDDQNEKSFVPVKSADQLAINQKYAQRYDTWRSKEEMQKRNTILYTYF